MNSSAAASDPPSAPRHISLRTEALILGILLIAAAGFRLSLVSGYHVAAVDGIQYYSLSQQLFSFGRFAFSPPPAALTYSRLPGYPLFAAFIAVRHAVDLATHVLYVTRAHAILDVGTALLVFLTVRLLVARFLSPLASFFAALFGFFAVVFTPLLFILASHALTESLATFLTALELYFALRATRGRLLLFSALAGVVAGIGQLVRADAISIAPAVFLAIASAAAPLRARVRAASAFVIVAALLFSPWPIRNLIKFGKPYPFSWQWRNARTGTPLPTGLLSWARTFTTATRDEAFLDPMFAFELPWSRFQISAKMYDSEAEKQELYALADRYNRERLSPAVDAEFLRIAKARAARAPFRTYFVLPIKRLAALFQSVPNSELSMKASILGFELPQQRPLVRYWDLGIYFLALFGALGLLTKSALVRVLAVAIATRCLLLCFTVPLGLSQRFLIEAFPALIALAACGVLFPVTRFRTK